MGDSVVMRRKMGFENAMVKAKAARSMGSALAILQRWADAEFRDHRSKVTDEMIDEMRQAHLDGEHLLEIADRHGLSETTARRIVQRLGRYRTRGAPAKD